MVTPPEAKQALKRKRETVTVRLNLGYAGYAALRHQDLYIVCTSHHASVALQMPPFSTSSYGCNTPIAY